MTRRDPAALCRDISLFFVSVGLLWWFQNELVTRKLMSGDNVQDIIIGAVFLFICVVAIFALIFLFEALFLVPSHMWSEVNNRAKALERRIISQITVSLPIGNGMTTIESGTTHQTIGGRRQTVLIGRADVVRLLCTNTGLETTSDSVARLLAAWRVLDGEEINLGIIESIQLPWDRAPQYPIMSTTIEPGDTKCLYIATILPNGLISLFRDLKHLPIEYHQMFSEAGLYRLLIQIKPHDGAPRRVLMEIQTKEVPPVQNKLPVASATVTILDQDALLPSPIDKTA